MQLESKKKVMENKAERFFYTAEKLKFSYNN